MKTYVRYSRYSEQHFNTGTAQHKVHHVVVPAGAPETPEPEDDPGVFAIVDAFGSAGDQQEILRSAQRRWDKRRSAEADMAHLFYTLADRLMLAGHDLIDAPVLAVRGVNLDPFDVAYVLERLSTHPAYNPAFVLLVETEKEVVRLGNGIVRYLAAYPASLEASEYTFDRQTLHFQF